MSAPDAPDFDEERTIRVLDQHGVQYVLVGGLGAVFHGATRPTMDFDMCASWELANLGRLADALNELAGKLKVRDLPAHMELPKATPGSCRKRRDPWRTSAGDIDILVGIPSDPSSDLERFEALRSRAERYEVAGCSVNVADLADIVASKRVAMRPSDIEALPELEALLAPGRDVGPPPDPSKGPGTRARWSPPDPLSRVLRAAQRARHGPIDRRSCQPRGPGRVAPKGK